MEDVRRLGALEGADINKAKEVLAYETTKIVHGQEEAEKAQVAAKSIFVHGTKSADMPTTTYPKAELEEGKDLITLLVDTKLAKNRSEGRRLIQQGGVTVNDEKITDSPGYLPLQTSMKRALWSQKNGKKWISSDKSR